MQPTRRCLVPAVFAPILSLACSAEYISFEPDFPTPTPEAIAGLTYVIYEDTQLNHTSGLGIACAQITDRQFTDEQGTTWWRPEAGLSISVARNPPEGMTPWAHAGQQIRFSRFLIKIVAINQDEESLMRYVRVAITELE